MSKKQDRRDARVLAKSQQVQASMPAETEQAQAIEAQAGNGKDKEYKFGMKTLSALVSRFQLAARAGLRFGGLRDFYSVFGWKTTVTTNDFMGKYIRQDIASRIVDAPPGATWSDPPKFVGNDAAKSDWDGLNEEHDLWGTMHRADRLCRLNHFSIVLFGFDDGSNLERPVGTVRELLYARPVGSRLIREVTFNDDARNRRFGLPETYKITFDDPSKRVVNSREVSTGRHRDLVVHHSRVVHIVENPLEDIIFGTPIMEKVFNLLDDLMKVAGGTSEVYWLTANRGLHADIDKEMDIDPKDAAALSDEIEEYQHQLRRVIRTRGVDLNVLESSTPSPKETFDMLMALISGTTGIPRRILLGSEAGQLASEQDRANWAERIAERRALFAEPHILKPVMTKLQEVGLVAEGSVEFDWPTAFKMSPLEASMVMAQKARAIGNISRQTGNKNPMQLTSVVEGSDIIGLEGDLAESDILEPPEEEVRVPAQDDDDDTTSRSRPSEEPES